MSGKGSARRSGAGYEDAWERIFGKKEQGCGKCGCKGIHACPGQPIPPWTDEKKAELKSVLDEIMKED